MGTLYKTICESCSYEDTFTYGQGMTYGYVHKLYYGKNKFKHEVESTEIKLVTNIEELNKEEDRKEVDLDASCGQTIRCPKCKENSLQVLNVGLWD